MDSGMIGSHGIPGRFLRFFFFKSRGVFAEEVVFFFELKMSGLGFRSGSAMICNRCFPITSKYLFTFSSFRTEGFHHCCRWKSKVPLVPFILFGERSSRTTHLQIGFYIPLLGELFHPHPRTMFESMIFRLFSRLVGPNLNISPEIRVASNIHPQLG